MQWKPFFDFHLHCLVSQNSLVLYPISICDLLSVSWGAPVCGIDFLDATDEIGRDVPICPNLYFLSLSQLPVCDRASLFFGNAMFLVDLFFKVLEIYRVNILSFPCIDVFCPS